MVIAALILCGAVLGVAVARRRRKQLLAGLNAAKPVFQVEPPSRRIASRKHEAL